jgi:5,10-methylenetetrahydromethanopterin reductase
MHGNRFAWRPEFWRPLLPRTVVESGTMAAVAEAAGWDGVTFGDSQNAHYDPYVSLAVAATATTRVMLGTSVTNSATRHPAVAATGFASLQQLSAGRVVLGIGRGDSAVHFHQPDADAGRDV